MNVASIAAAQSATAQTRVRAGISTWALKATQESEQQVLALIEQAVESATAVAAPQGAAGGRLDVTG